jgi:hypothetical protein|tara:strand:- start:849 stop:2804 length:1956 start_codon:yes stop_codon:yes gene_type:complete
VEYYKLAIAVIWPILVTIKIIYDTRGVCFAGSNVSTDNEKMLKAASKINLLHWPSKMHLIEGSRAETREYWVIALKLLQFLFKNKMSEHVNFTLALISNCISSILIYFVISNYFNSDVGLIVSLLYSTCLWSYQIIFVIGHVHLAQMFFLLAILLLQRAVTLGDKYAVYFYFLAGMFTVISFVSSSASRKYPLLAVLVFIFSLQKFMIFPWEKDYYTPVNLYLLSVILFLSIFFNRIVRYMKAYIIVVVEKITNKNLADKDVHLEAFSRIILSLLLVLVFFRTIYPDINAAAIFLMAYFLGVLIVTAHVLLPVSELKANTSRYLTWLMGTWRSHFSAYPDQERIFGKKLPEGFRGEGLSWIYRFFWRVIPIHFVLYFLSIVVVAYYTFNSPGCENLFLAFIFLVVVIIVSLFPLIISEITSSLQVGKAYFPSFIGFLFMIGMALEKIFNTVNGNEKSIIIVYAIVFTVIVLQVGLSIYFYFKDVLPARMAATILKDNLRKINVTQFYTYDNAYNDSLVKTMIYSYPNEFDVKYINSIEEVKEGIIVIPGTSSKSESMESQQYSIINGDFKDDKTLNELYENKDIEKLAISKIRTRGCSRYFVLETEVTGYRDLILKQVSDYDHWIANAWVLSAETVHDFITSKHEKVSCKN